MHTDRKGEAATWTHCCKVLGTTLGVGVGESCNWCGARAAVTAAAATAPASPADPAARHQAALTPTILTAQGTYFELLNPAGSPINVEMVAHALANLCRFTGHCRQFYSVAQHAVLVSHLVPPAFAYEGLHHDDAEAFVGDVASPLKKLMPGYREIERAVEAAVFARMGLPAELPWEVKHADLIALRTEQRDLMHAAGGLWKSLAGVEPADCPPIEPLPPGEARELFLERHAQLAAQRSQA